MIRKEAWSFYRTSSGVRLCWELEEPKGPKKKVGQTSMSLETVQGYLTHEKLPLPGTIVKLCLGPYGGPRGVHVCFMSKVLLYYMYIQREDECAKHP